MVSVALSIMLFAIVASVDRVFHDTNQNPSCKICPACLLESDATDLFQYAGKTFLVVTEKFSGWPVVKHCLRDAISPTVIWLQKDCFTDKGIPLRLATNSGLQF